MLRTLVLLVLAASVLVAGSADAHVGGLERAAFEAPELPAQAVTSSPTHFLIAGDATSFPWPMVLMALLAATALGRRRSRQLVAAGLVVLLAVLGVEAAIHSVHHAPGSEPVACPTASMAAHLDGTEAVSPAVDLPIDHVGAVAATSAPRVAALRSLDASHPRAPPAPLV